MRYKKAMVSVEENARPPQPYIEPWRRAAEPIISVCLGGACSQDGSHMALREIEDLVAAVGGGEY